jgi:hypothetical protein
MKNRRKPLRPRRLIYGPDWSRTNDLVLIRDAL